MSNACKLMIIESRINLLRTRGETMNAALIKKLERKKRALTNT